MNESELAKSLRVASYSRHPSAHWQVLKEAVKKNHIPLLLQSMLYVNEYDQGNCKANYNIGILLLMLDIRDFGVMKLDYVSNFCGDFFTKNRAIQARLNSESNYEFTTKDIYLRD